MRNPSTLTRTALASVCGLALTLGSGAATAVASEGPFVEQATSLGAAPSGTVNATEILFPALMDMAEPPMDLSLGAGMDALLMLQPGDADWRKMERWAEGEEQRAVLAAIAEITDPDAKKLHVLEVPFGFDATDAMYMDEGLWIELPTDELLASAEFHYLTHIERAAGLAMFEAMRLAEAGEGGASLKLLGDALLFGKMVAERPTVKETKAGFGIMRIASERSRDVVYTHPDSFTADQLVEHAERFDERVLRPRLIPFPGAEELAARQLVARVFEERGGVKPGEFAQTLAMLEAGDTPLRRMSEAARFRDASRAQADWFDHDDWILRVFGDFKSRWRIPGYRDAIFDKTPQLQQADGRALTMIKYVADDLSDLRDVRTALEVDMGGTMNALGVVAFSKSTGSLPPELKAVEPVYVNKLFTDPYNPNQRYEGNVFYDMNYWVPIRDQTFDRRVGERPYEVTVTLPGEGESMFAASAPATGAADAVLRSLSDTRPNIAGMIGRAASEIKLTNWHNGDAITMAGSEGDIRVLIFWATWCGPCKAAIPGNNQVYNKYKDQGVTLFGVCDNNGGNTMARTADQHSMAYPTGMMASGSPEARAYNLPHWPFSVIVDRAGTIRAAGVRPGDLDQALAALVAEQPAGWTGGDTAQAAGFEDMELGDFEDMDFGDLENMGDLEAAMGDMAGQLDELMNMTNREVFAMMNVTPPAELEPILDMKAMETEQMSDAEFQRLLGMSKAEAEALAEKAMMEQMGGMMGMGGMGGGDATAGAEFTVLLDETQFLLYSSGPDGMDNRAKEVGAGGGDVLIWPPLMSLARKHAQGEL
ncbi:MAG: TlpA disulfide reductase family protein [Planctomycetota bacterium]